MVFFFEFLKKWENWYLSSEKSLHNIFCHLRSLCLIFLNIILNRLERSSEESFSIVQFFFKLLIFVLKINLHYCLITKSFFLRRSKLNIVFSFLSPCFSRHSSSWLLFLKHLIEFSSSLISSFKLLWTSPHWLKRIIMLKSSSCSLLFSNELQSTAFDFYSLSSTSSVK